MSRDELNETLASLHDTLNSTTDVDDKTRELLTSVTADIKRLLEQDESTSDATDETFSDQLRDMAVEFEARHPQIGGLLQRLSAGLASLGI